MEKIMILGAGVYQAPLIRRASARGLHTLAVSVAGPYPGLALADQVVPLDTRDRAGILQAAQREGIVAIATTGTDVAMPALGAVCDAMGLPGVSLETALNATDKIRMKEAFRRSGVPTSDFQAVSSLEEAEQAARRIGYPVMVKIPDKSGSRGICRADSSETLGKAWAWSRAATEAECLLVEGFVSGREFGVDAAVQAGKVIAIIPHEKRVHFSGRAGVPAGHLCPSAFSPETEEKIMGVTQRVCAALGLRDCAVNLDAMLTPEGEVSVIEAAARCGGTGIPEVISGALGVDWYDVILDLALGRQVKLPAGAERGMLRGAAASRMITAPHSGRLKDIFYRAEGNSYRNRDYDGKDIHVSLNAAPGDEVHDFENGTERLGQAIFTGQSREQVLKMEQAFLESLQVEVAQETAGGRSQDGHAGEGRTGGTETGAHGAASDALLCAQ